MTQLLPEKGYIFYKVTSGTVWLYRHSVSDLDIKGVEVELMRDIGIILLRFKTVLCKDTPFECHRCGRPVLAGHRVGKADDQVELADFEQGSID